MNILLKNASIAGILLLAFALSSNAQARKRADKDTKAWRYEIECAGNGSQGTYLIKVWSYVKSWSDKKSQRIAIEQAKKNAIHGVVFKGFASKGTSCAGQKAMTDASGESKHEKFYNDFFADDGDYKKFIVVSGDGSVGPGDRIKVGKEYKVGVVVSVNKTELRKYLEKAGVIKSLSSGF